MKNLQQFSAKVQYVTPSCKTVTLQARDVILQGSFGDEGRAGRNGGWEEDGEDY